MNDTEIPWYEKPVKVNPIGHTFEGIVENGDRGRLPERLFWKDEEEQRADIAEVQELALELEWEEFLNVVAPLGGVGEPDGSTGA
jgi:hypothetical protein